jgi:hypothetical protein
MAEALEGAKHATSLVRDGIAKLGAQSAGRDGGEGLDESGGLSPVERKARQAVLDATRRDPISDPQMERLVRVALGNKTRPKVVPRPSGRLAGAKCQRPLVQPRSLPLATGLSRG